MEFRKVIIDTGTNHDILLHPSLSITFFFSWKVFMLTTSGEFTIIQYCMYMHLMFFILFQMLCYNSKNLQVYNIFLNDM